LVVATLVVAAGRGVRAGDGPPKQYRRLGGIPVLRRTLDAFLGHAAIGLVQAVIHPDDAGTYAGLAAEHPKLRPPVPGGASRQESVRAGLEALAAAAPDLVLIQDGARPFASPGLIGRVVEALAEHAAVLPASAVTDTLKRGTPAGFSAGTVPRDGLFAAETPQGFRYAAIRAAHAAAAASGEAFTDDAAIAEWAGLPVRLVAGERGNVKLTTPEDFTMAERRLAAARETRVGTGYDVHAFGPGDHVMLGGIAIPHGEGLVGHSDADVALHALTDAILGALADGDIGAHFPPADPAWKGAASARFLADAAGRVAARGGRILHLDLAIIAEAPRIGPHRDAMRERIAAIAGISPGRVAVKATTNERLGFVGRREGIAAIGTATLSLPEEEMP
jgi:2-C-methyl-D-erythritol 4-phosphate cytidylyltransferase/2-C-methyl-D-erythritol 2,4-cyclodiphosphate synthase